MRSGPRLESRAALFLDGFLVAARHRGACLQAGGDKFVRRSMEEQPPTDVTFRGGLVVSLCYRRRCH